MTSLHVGTETETKQDSTNNVVDALNIESGNGNGNGVELVLTENGVFTQNVDDDEEHYSGKDKLCSQLRSAFVGFLFPKVTPIKASTFLLLTFLAILP